MTSFEIAVVHGGDHVVQLEVEGEVDLSTAPQLLDSVLAAAVAHERHNIVLDLRNVEFIDSAGLGAIVRADGRVRDLNAHLIIGNPSRTVQRLFEATGLDDHLDVRPAWTANGVNRNPLG